MLRKESALLALKSMVSLGSDSENRITFILCGQPELKATLKYSQFPALKQRIRLFFHRQGMSLQETCVYIDYQTEITGKPTSIFADDTKGKIHHSAEGIPRRINTMPKKCHCCGMLRQPELRIENALPDA